MPIMRTYMCGECSHRMEVTLPADQWDAPPPSCDACDARMGQEFKAPAIGGSKSYRAHKLAEDIIANDYGVADVKFDNRQGGTPKVRYKDQTAASVGSSWQGANPVARTSRVDRQADPARERRLRRARHAQAQPCQRSATGPN